MGMIGKESLTGIVLTEGMESLRKLSCLWAPDEHPTWQNNGPNKIIMKRSFFIYNDAS